MSPASSTGRKFSRSSPARRLNAWSSAASFLAAWFSSSKPPSVPSKAASAKSASSAAPRPALCYWLRTRRNHPPMTERPRSLERAASACLGPPRKRLSRRHDGYFIQKEVAGAFRAQAPVFVCAEDQTRYAPARCREVPPAYLQAPARDHDPRPRRLHLRRHWQEVSGFSWRYRRECAWVRARAHRESNPPRSCPRHSPLEPLSQCLPGSACPSPPSSPGRSSCVSTMSLILSRNSTTPSAPSFLKQSRAKGESIPSAKYSGIALARLPRSTALS